MAKSNLKLLEEAIASGDTVKAQELLKKIQPKKAKTKTKAKAKPEPKVKPRVQQPILEPSHDLNAGVHKTGLNVKGGTFIGSDGQEHSYGRTESLAGTVFKNTFNPQEYADRTPENIKKFEKKISKFKATPRPGSPGASRDIVSKVKVRCSICGSTVEVYPSEIGEGGSTNYRCSKRSCVRAR